MRALYFLLSFLLVVPYAVCSADDSEGGCLVEPNIDPALTKKWEESGLQIGSIVVDTSPVFDESNPDENNWLYRWVNKLHINTDPDIIKDDLLFKEGDAFTAEHLAESERILRKRPYLRNAAIEPMGDCSNKVDLKVKGREVWTLLPEISYSHKGGNSTSRFGLRDQNFLGTGKAVTVQRESNPDRTSYEYTYRDPNFTSLRAVIDIEYADSSDGKSLKTELQRPFYALDVPWSAALRTLNDEKVASVFRDGKRVFDFQTEKNSREISYGWLFHSSNSSADRLYLGYSELTETFLDNTATQDLEYFAIPEDREYQFAWLGYERYTGDYVKAKNINQMSIIEDLNSSWIVSSRLGIGTIRTTDPYGMSDKQDLYALNLNAIRSVIFDENSIAELLFELNSKFGNNGAFDSLAEFDFRYHQFGGGDDSSQLYANIKYVHGFDLPLDHLVYLGGDNGLRGYPRNYLTGENSLLLTLERRFYVKREWLALADVGAVLFVDAGKTDGRDDFESRWLRDVGFGVRLSPTRTGSHRSGSTTVIHMDFAFPLDERDVVGNWQWLVQAKNSF